MATEKELMQLVVSLHHQVSVKQAVNQQHKQSGIECQIKELPYQDRCQQRKGNHYFFYYRVFAEALPPSPDAAFKKNVGDEARGRKKNKSGGNRIIDIELIQGGCICCCRIRR